jgi:hypothetical protein
MAIGSEPEIGVEFRRWGLMTEDEKLAWFKFLREHHGPDGVGGYGTICYPKRTPQDEL